MPLYYGFGVALVMVLAHVILCNIQVIYDDNDDDNEKDEDKIMISHTVVSQGAGRWWQTGN